MLPRVKIIYDNGSIGTPLQFDDGVAGLITNGIAVADKFELGKPYQIRSLEAMKELGITDAEGDANHVIYKFVKEFYSQTQDGSELWLMAMAQTVGLDVLVDKDSELTKVRDMLLKARGKICTLGVLHNPAASYTAVSKKGLDEKVYAAMAKAQDLADWMAYNKFAPLMVVLPGNGYTGVPADLNDLGEMEFNRVCCLIGDTVADSKTAAVGLLLGRIAAIPVQRSVARKASGAVVKEGAVYVKDKDADVADVESISDKGFITFRTFVGSAGYYFSDDKMACRPADDYSLIPRRRVVDKAARIGYVTMVEKLCEELPVTNAGTLVPALAQSWKVYLENAILDQMAPFNNLGGDPTDANDTGVEVTVDYNQNVVVSQKLTIYLKVKPYGYAKYIDVVIGFVTLNEQ